MAKESQTKRFCSCIKQVRKTLKSRKESGAIAICVKSVLQKHGRTLKKFSCKKGRVITQPTRKQQGGERRYVLLADTEANHARDPFLKPTVKILRPKGSVFILKPGDKVTHVHYLKDNNGSGEETFTYVNATFRKNHRSTGPPYIVTNLHFRDDRGFIDRVDHHRFRELAKTIRLVSMKDMYLSPASKSISMSVSKSKSRSRRSH
jgi:hypothetical protein